MLVFLEMKAGLRDSKYRPLPLTAEEAREEPVSEPASQPQRAVDKPVETEQPALEKVEEAGQAKSSESGGASGSVAVTVEVPGPAPAPKTAGAVVVPPRPGFEGPRPPGPRQRRERGGRYRFLYDVAYGKFPY